MRVELQGSPQEPDYIARYEKYRRKAKAAKAALAKSRGAAKVAWYDKATSKKKKSKRRGHAHVAPSNKALQSISQALASPSGAPNEIWVLDSAASWPYLIPRWGVTR